MATPDFQKELPKSNLPSVQGRVDGACITPSKLGGEKGQLINDALNAPYLFGNGTCFPTTTYCKTGCGEIKGSSVDGLTTAVGILGAITTGVAVVQSLTDIASIFKSNKNTRSTENTLSTTAKLQKIAEDKDTGELATNLENTYNSSLSLNANSKTKDLQKAVESLTEARTLAYAKRQSIALEIATIDKEISGYGTEIRAKEKVIKDNGETLQQNAKTRTTLNKQLGELTQSYTDAKTKLNSMTPEEKNDPNNAAEIAELQDIVNNYENRKNDIEQQLDRLDREDNRLREQNQKAEAEIKTNIPAKIDDAEARKQSLIEEQNKISETSIKNADSRIKLMNSWIEAQNK